MPFKRAYRPRRRFRRRNRNPMATRTRMMSRSLAFKRHNQVSTKVFYFKQNGTIISDLAGNYYGNWRSRNLLTNPPFGILQLFDMYDQYKILAYTVRFFPANVGIESDSAIFAAAGLKRGNTIVWSDQRFDSNQATPSSISNVINNASSRIINSRRPYKRTIFRAKGNPNWGSCHDYTTDPDPWDSSIEILVNDATPSSLTPPLVSIQLYFYTVSWKVIVRGRRQE